MLRYASLVYSSVLAERRVYIMQGLHNFDWNKCDNGNVTYKHQPTNGNISFRLLLLLLLFIWCWCLCIVSKS